MGAMQERVISSNQLRVDLGQGGFLGHLKDTERFVKKRGGGNIIDIGFIDSRGNSWRIVVGQAQTIREIFPKVTAGQATDVVRLDIPEEELVKELFEITPSIVILSERGKEFRAAVNSGKLLNIGNIKDGKVTRTIIGPANLITQIFPDEGIKF